MCIGKRKINDSSYNNNDCSDYEADAVLVLYIYLLI